MRYWSRGSALRGPQMNPRFKRVQAPLLPPGGPCATPSPILHLGVGRLWAIARRNMHDVQTQDAKQNG